MSRSPSESSCWLVPDCGMHVPPPQASLNALVARLVGPVSVELAGVVKWTWNWKAASVLALAPRDRTLFRSPAGGWVLLSRSDARKLLTFVGPLNEMLVAGWPASIAERLSAATLGPRNV